VEEWDGATGRRPRFRIILDRAGSTESEPDAWKGRDRAWGIAASRAAYLNSHGERSQTDTDDLNVPLRLECELAARDRRPVLAS
jgi:hypothetical protein